MSVVSVELVPEAWGGEYNKLWQRTYTQTYRVTTNDPTDGPVVCLSAKDPSTGLKIPNIGTFYYVSSVEFDAGSYVVSVQPRVEARAVDQGGYAWLVTVNYGPFEPIPESTLDWPAVAWVDFQKYEKVLTADVSGNPIRNSAKEPFDEPITVDDSRCLLHVRRNVAVKGYNYALASTFRDKLNLNVWNTFAAKTVKCSEINTGEPQFDSKYQVWYYAEQSTFEVTADDWQNHQLDRGYSVLDTSSPPKQKRLTGPDGQPLSEATLLDGSGAKLASTGTPVFLPFDVYVAVDFAPLNIDLSKAWGR